MSGNLTCLGCGWVHFEVTERDANASVKSYNDWVIGISADDLELWDMTGKERATLRGYQHCFLCGAENAATNFRPSKDDDCPIGCTLQPIYLRR